MNSVRLCEGCGSPLERKRYPSGILEGPARFAKRRFCNHLCRAKVMNTPQAGCGSQGGYRRGCRCDNCRRAASEAARQHRKQPMPAHVQHGTGAARSYGCTCRECHEFIKAANRDSRIKNQALTQDGATRSEAKDVWTGAELDLLLRDDLSHAEVARLLKRTYYAVRHARNRLRRDPGARERGGFIGSTP